MQPNNLVSVRSFPLRPFIYPPYHAMTSRVHLLQLTSFFLRVSLQPCHIQLVPKKQLKFLMLQCFNVSWNSHVKRLLLTYLFPGTHLTIYIHISNVQCQRGR